MVEVTHIGDQRVLQEYARRAKDDIGEATDTEKLWQQVRSLQLQLKGIEEKLYALADQLYTHEHPDGEKR